MEAFGTVLIAITVVAAVIACASYVGSGRIYRDLGRTGLSLDEPDLRPGPTPGTPAWEAEASEEVRTLVVAANERRLRRGERPLEVDAEIERRLSDFGA